MRWATFRSDDSAENRVGLVVDNRIHALEPGLRLIDLLGDDGERLAEAGERARSGPVEVLPVADVRLRPPIPQPPSIRDFYAFEQHVKAGRERRGLEMDPVWYEIPVFYFTNPHVTIGDADTVAVPPGCEALDFELEMAAVIGRDAADLDPEEAEKVIVGYVVMNDWSARDLQMREMSVGLGPAKGKDFSTTMGPWMVTPDELAPFRKDLAFDLTMTAKVNGKEYSRGNASDIYWSFGEMVSFASRGSQLRTGDIVGSGTCGTGCIAELGLRFGRDVYPWLKAGDEVELAIEHLGTIRNRVVEGLPLRPLRP
jgi:2-keto-4-pentenoate hydratase/2-oxohepta-3-ene-1,7-dioic acid hydratase in catechol pathway